MQNLPDFETLLVKIDAMTAYVTLNRPETRNAMNYKMVTELYDLFTMLKDNQDIRAVVLSGADGTFCSGGDIKEMRANPVPARESGGNLDAMLRACNQASQVVIARVEGAAMGGGLGLLCVSDVAIASEDTKFALPEVRLGVAPAFISPFVLQRMGLTRARELMLTGRRFTGTQAYEYGLIHSVAPAGELDYYVEQELYEISQCAPGAIAATKALIFEVLDKSLDETVDYRANTLNTLRTGDEAQEGMLAFMEKRSAKWVTSRKRT
ncbi:MAG: enoyl-CoA hydratase/isomerase family protein [Aggregatilineales bacterium]